MDYLRSKCHINCLRLQRAGLISTSGAIGHIACEMVRWYRTVPLPLGRDWAQAQDLPVAGYDDLSIVSALVRLGRRALRPTSLHPTTNKRAKAAGEPKGAPGLSLLARP